MRTIVRGKNFEVPEADRVYVETKLHRLDRLLGERAEVTAELGVERHRSAATSHAVTLSLDLDGRPLHGTARAATHRAAMDEVVDRLERRAVDLKERRREADRPGAATTRQPRATPAEAGPDEVRRVVKVKRFALEPMFEEDAVARMEDLGHSFFVFVNAEDERLNVLYRRRDGDYGLIDPVIAGEYGTGRSHRRG